MDKFPILNQRGELATVDEVTAQVGSPIVSGTIEVVALDTVNNTSTLESINGVSLSGVSAGDTIVITAQNYLDNTYIYTIVIP